MNASSVRDTALSTKSMVAEGQKQIRAKHDAGASGSEVGALLTDLADTAVLNLLRRALAQGDTSRGDTKSEPAKPKAAADNGVSTTEPSGAPQALAFPDTKSFALVALGGYGRRDLAPFSDIDLMFLIQPGADEELKPIVMRVSQDIYDAGLQLGMSVRDTNEACQLAMQDPVIFTSLCEARYLAGNIELFETFRERFAKLTQRRGFSLLETSLAARREERAKFGETVFLLSPNVKRSRGGLRDLQLVRWIGFARFGQTDYDQIYQQKALSQNDLDALLAAREHLLRVRNELHFHANKAQDVLTREEQVRIAEKFGFEGTEGVLPVEQFMQGYFEHTSQIRYIAANFTQTARSRFGLRQWVGPVFSFNVAGDYRIGPVHVTATKQGLEKLSHSMVDVLRLMDLANSYNRRIDHGTWMSIRESMAAQESIEITPDVAERFLAFMGETSRLGPLLRRMHELRVLEKIIPPVKRSRCLLQFNEYHKYTVDEHTFRAVEAAAALANEEGTLADIYRSIKNPRLVHLGLLFHDLGKGDKRDHSELGEELAHRMGERLFMNEDDTEAIAFLVRYHLTMPDLAFYRDINDESVVANFAALVQSVEMLKMLYVLSCSDLRGVGPDVLNDWKLRLLTELYFRTRNRLMGRSSDEPRQAEVDQTCENIQGVIENHPDREAIDELLRSLPPAFVLDQADATLLKKLEAWVHLTEDAPAVHIRTLDDTKNHLEFVVAAIDRPQSGIFHRITGSLTSGRLEILSVDATPFGKQGILNRFLVKDLDASSQGRADKLSEISDRIVNVLTDSDDPFPTFPQVWKPAQSALETQKHRLPTRVKIDNDSSDNYTILDVFAHDRLGLLYRISRAIFELGLEVHYAKVGTFLDQVMDVFYVTDQSGEKMFDVDRQREIREHLVGTIESFESSGE